MLSRSKPEQHREWETVCMECGSEIYPPRATSPSVQSKACKEIAALRRQLATARDALRGIWPFIEEDDGGFATPAYQKAINDVRAALAMTEDANP